MQVTAMCKHTDQAMCKRTDQGTDCRQLPAVMLHFYYGPQNSRNQNRDANVLSLGLVCIAGYICEMTVGEIIPHSGCEPAVKTGCLIWPYVTR